MTIETLGDYLRAAFESGQTDHALHVKIGADNTIEFSIERDDRLDDERYFIVTGDVVRMRTPID